MPAKGSRTVSRGLADALRAASAAGAPDLDNFRREGAEQAARDALAKLKVARGRVRTKQGKIRRAKFLAEVLALRLENFTNVEIAEILACTPDQVTYALTRARDDADVEAQLKRVDEVAVPLAVDNLIEGVINRDKAYTLRVLDGRGLFRTHKSIDAQVTQRVLIMKVSVEAPPGGQIPPPKAGSTFGTPIAPKPVAGVVVTTPAGATRAVLEAAEGVDA